MSKMISVASGFQYSVNIGYDLSSNEKLKNFIPTKSSLGLLEEILLSTAETSTERSRVLIGAYGKGKSHIVLTILSILMKRDLRLFEKLLPKLEEHPKLKQCVLNYYESPNIILPVVITGSNTSLSQAFLLALQRTLSDNDLLDVMPETNYKAAISVIERWEKDFPETYTAFEAAILMVNLQKSTWATRSAVGITLIRKTNLKLCWCKGVGKCLINNIAFVADMLFV